jgi:NAD(P)H-hydrate repair Nnr-like enzyme with NAD(P)H-hydrate dehydratase domain
MQFGMGEKTGVFSMPRQKESNVHPAQILAPDTLQQMDAEVAQLLKESYARALHVLTTHRDEWERLAQALIEHEVLDAKQVAQACAGQAVTRKVVHKFQPTPPKSPASPPPATAPPNTQPTGPATKPLAAVKPTTDAKA